MRRLVDKHLDLIRSDALDGRLALRAFRARGHAQHLERIGALRHCLELARFNGFADTLRQPSDWFDQLFEPGGAYTCQPPAPLDEPATDLSEDLQLYLDLALAVVFARSWEERRRILVAYDGVNEQIVRTLDSLAAQPELSAVAAPLVNVIRDGRRRGWWEACADAPQIFPAESGTSGIDRSYLTVDEQLQLTWLAYLEAPAWHQRRELVIRNAALLFDPDHQERLSELWRQAQQQLPNDMVSRARTVLERVKQLGVSEGFSEPLPSTLVIKAAAQRALPAATGVARVLALRTLTHFHNASLWPTMHARLNWMLAAALLSSREGPPGPFAVEEASWRAQEAMIDLGPVDVRTDQLARDICTTAARVQIQRLRGPKDRHVEAAIQLLEEAIEATPDEVEVAKLHAELAKSFLMRISGVELENASRAAEHAAKVLQLASRNRDTALLVEGHTLVGTAIHKCLPPGESVDRSEAVEHLKQALALSRQDAQASALPHLYLGMVYAASGPPTHALTMQHLERALVCFSREQSPWRWAEIHEIMGNALLRGRPDDPGAWSAARSHYLLALQQYDGAPRTALRCAVSIATTYFRASDWQSALTQYQRVLDLADDIERYEVTESGRLNLISALRDVHEREAYCLAQLGRHWQALEALERGRLSGLRRLYGGSQWARTGRQDPDHVLKGIGATSSPTVVPLVTSAGSLVLILIDNGQGPELSIVPLPGLTDRDLRLLFDGGPERRGWLFAYNDYLRAGSSQDLNSDDDAVRDCARVAEEDKFDRWSTEIWLALRDLGRLLMGPVAAALRSVGVPEGSRVRFVPSKWLNIVPLHAAPDADGRPFMDHFPLATLPCLWLLKEVAKAEPPPREPTLVSLVADREDLAFAAGEAQAVAYHFGHSDLLRADSAGVAALTGLLARATHLHVVSHGSYDWSRPAESGLILSDGALLSAEALRDLPLAATDLVTLSACETGLTDVDRLPGEYLGLPGILLAAGARTIVSSLWVVDDAVTQQFMGAFYAHLLANKDPAMALAAAQEAVRRAGYGAPFYWAAFTLIDCR